MRGYHIDVKFCINKTMKKILISILVGLTSVSLFSQQNIEVLNEVDSRGNYNFYCINNDYCNYTVMVYFKEISNLRWDIKLPYEAEVTPGRNSLFTLYVGDPNQNSNFNYGFSYYKGCLKPEVNLNFPFRLPIAVGKQTQAFKLDYLKINNHDTKPKDFYAIGFKVASGDTIFAARRGVVCGLRDTTNLKLNGYLGSSGDNYVEIYHQDCSFGYYQIMSKVLVKLGQEVEAGDAIAIAGGEKYYNGSQFRFWVYYNLEHQPDLKNKAGSNVIIETAYFPLKFYTKEERIVKLDFEQKYTCDYPDFLFFQEMTKREIKKWKKKKENLKK